eukprot:TRINITY_DN0_c0_g2_i1.p1 TRINITY_DN0_c0_g2~~TRINITY_DN0_c0_g2_i1.p1  ORF type:complete len:157 (-),score=15.69 TRINITY_DN0_c0_g2_i1:816-1286(-)
MEMETETVVVAVDGSEESLQACEWACKHVSEIQNHKAFRLVLLHVQPVPCFSAGPAYILGREALRLLEKDRKRSAERIMQRALQICNKHSVEAETHVVMGDTKDMICKTCTKLGAHFLVMGNHGHGFFLRAIRGSVSDYCQRKAECPVVVVNSKVF